MLAAESEWDFAVLGYVGYDFLEGLKGLVCVSAGVEVSEVMEF